MKKLLSQAWSEACDLRHEQLDPPHKADSTALSEFDKRCAVCRIKKILWALVSMEAAHEAD